MKYRRKDMSKEYKCGTCGEIILGLNKYEVHYVNCKVPTKEEIEKAYYDRCKNRIEGQKSYEGKRLLINRATTLEILKSQLTK